MIRRVVCLLCLALVWPMSAARPAEYSWLNPGGGNWNESGKWSPSAIPGAADSATLGLPSGSTFPYVVNLTDAQAINNLTLSAASATLAQSGGTLTVGGTFAVNAGAYNLSGGTLAVNGSLTTAAGTSFNWAGGTLSSVNPVTLSGPAVLSGGGNKSLDGGGLALGGGGTWSGGNVYAGGGAVVTVPAGRTLTATGDNTLYGYTGGGGLAVAAGGVFRKDGGTGTTRFATNSTAPTLTNAGLVEAATGTLQLPTAGTFSYPGTFRASGAGALVFAGGSHTLTSGGRVEQTGGGQVVFGDGAVAFAAGSTLAAPSLAVYGGSVTLDTGAGHTFTTLAVYGGTLGGADAVTAGSLTWTDGTWAGAAAKTVTGPAVLSGGGNKSLDGGGLALGGGGTWSGGNVYAGGGAVVTVPAGRTLTATGDNTLYGYTGGGGLAVAAGGVFRKDGGTGATQFAPSYTYPTLTNAGLVEVTTGTLNAGTLATNTGTFKVSSVGTITGTIATSAGGRVEGPANGVGRYGGSLTFNAGGTLAPGGGSLGVIALAGNLTLDGGTLDITVRNTPAVANSRVAVVGTVTLANNPVLTGTTTTATPTATDRLFILTNDGTDPISGTFAGLPQGGTGTLGGYSFRISYAGDNDLLTLDGGNDIVLYNLQPVPEPAAVLAVAAAGLAGWRGVRRRGRAA